MSPLVLSSLTAHITRIDSARGTTVRRALALVAVAAAGALLLAGCTTDTPAATSTSTADSTADPSDTASDSPLMAVYPDDFTAETAATETVRIADEIQGLMDASTILNVDDHPQIVDATETTGQYYGVLRMISLTDTTDPVLLAKVMVLEMKAVGWTEVNVDSTDGSYFVALASSNLEDEAWFLLLGGDTSDEGYGAITVQLASPTIPE